MTADNALTVVGGRNVGNEYFALDEGSNFADLDVFAVGPAAADVTDSFDVFWNNSAAIAVSAFHEPDQASGLAFILGGILVLFDSPDKMLAKDDSGVLLRQSALCNISEDSA